MKIKMKINLCRLSAIALDVLNITTIIWTHTQKLANPIGTILAKILDLVDWKHFSASTNGSVPELSDRTTN